MRYSILVWFLLPLTMWGQEGKRLSWWVGTTQGMSFVSREASSNTTEKTYPVQGGYTFSWDGGIRIVSKKGKSFSSLALAYSSMGNRFSGAITSSGLSTEQASKDRFNYLSLGYGYARYIHSLKQGKAYVQLGAEILYILNRKICIPEGDSVSCVHQKGSRISNNFVLGTPPRISLIYGWDWEKGPFSWTRGARFGLELNWDQAVLPISSPSHSYLAFGAFYQVAF